MTAKTDAAIQAILKDLEVSARRALSPSPPKSKGKSKRPPKPISTKILFPETEIRWTPVTDETLDSVFEKAMAQKAVAYDVETNGLKISDELIVVGFALSWERDHGYYFPLRHEYPDPSDFPLPEKFAWDGPLPEKSYRNLSGSRTLRALRELLGSDKILKPGSGTKFDYLVSTEVLKLPFRKPVDIGSMARLVRNYMKVGLKKLMVQEYERYPFEEESWKEFMKTLQLRFPQDLPKMPIPVMGLYNVSDTAFTYRLFADYLREIAPNQDLAKLLKLECDLIPIIAAMEREGVPIDVPYFKRTKEKLERELAQIEKNIQKVADCPINPASGDQVAAYLFKKKKSVVAGVTIPQGLGLRVVKKTGGGQSGKKRPSVDEEALETVLREAKEKGNDVPIIPLLLDHRHTGKMLSTYILGMLQRHENSVIHAKLNSEGARSSRFSCEDPNLQNIPKRKDPRVVRCGFVPNLPGEDCWEFLEGDSDQIEYRVFIHYTKDPALIQMVLDNHDFHKYAASLMFKKGIDTIEKKERDKGKTINYLCVPTDTLALTPDGWRGPDSVEVGSTVMGYNKRTRKMEWTKVRAVHHYAEAPIVKIAHSRWEARCTPNHRWIGQKRIWRSEGPRPIEDRVFRTDQITTEHRIRTSAPAATKHRLKISAKEAAIIGWVLTDGHIRRGKYTGAPAQAGGRKVAFNAAIHQQKPKFVKELDELLRFVPHSRYQYGEKVTFALAPNYARDLWARGRVDELGPEQFVLHLGTEERRAFYEAVVAAEGHAIPKVRGRYIISQNAGPFAEAIRLTIFLEGFRPTETPSTTQAGNTNLAMRNCDPVVGCTKIRTRKLKPGPVWCVTTDLGSWAVRQGTHIFLTGNSIFGGGVGQYVKQMGCSWEEGKQDFDLYHRSIPAVAELQTKTRLAIERVGSVRTIFGHERAFPKFMSYAAVDHFVQGSAATCLKYAIVRVNQMLKERGLKSKLLLCVHDSLLVRRHKDDDLFTLIAIMNDALTDFPMFRVPLMASFERSDKSWGDMEDIDVAAEFLKPDWEKFRSNLKAVCASLRTSPGDVLAWAEKKRPVLAETAIEAYDGIDKVFRYRNDLLQWKTQLEDYRNVWAQLLREHSGRLS